MRLSACSKEFQDDLQDLLKLSCEEPPEVQASFVQAYSLENYFSLHDIANDQRVSAIFADAVRRFARYF